MRKALRVNDRTGLHALRPWPHISPLIESKPLPLTMMARPDRISSARPRLVAQHNVVAQHPDNDGPFRQRFDLVGRARLIGGGVLDHWRAGCAGLRTCRRAAVQPECRDQEGGGRRLRASGGG